MKHPRLMSLILPCALVACQGTPDDDPAPDMTTRPETRMDLGAFSISLTVKDLDASSEFYGKLGFDEIGGDASQNWLILRNGTTVIGLFQGMFPRNMLTFNPGWDQMAANVDAFTDVRELQQRLLDAGVELQVKADPDTTGPASFVLSDPDGNPILVDQHR